MSQPDYRSLLKNAVLELKEMRGRLAAYESASNEPIAVIGAGCRFPGGVRDLESYWRLLEEGVDAIREIPRDRWDLDALYHPDPGVPGKLYSRWGGFLDEIDRFDPAFFGISPREALTMDPQQRILLEVAWEALENAGQAPDRLAGSQTGVFIGVTPSDYMQVRRKTNSMEEIDAYFGTGNALSVASGRLSYILGLHGPAISLDTACSSSLVAIHLACQSLRKRECRMALSGGVNLLISPEVSVIFSKARMLAVDGRCKTFDAAADGYVRGEGCGVVVLKRLSDAQADGDRILAVIRGSAVNQDGRSSGLTAPNGPAQEAVIRKALEEADVEPQDVTYVEAHGTGTALGDPIEVQALGSVMRGRPKDRPLYIGSVKTNLGHLEVAAGVAGFIKLVLMLHFGKIPPHLHFQTPSPHITWNELPIAVPTTLRTWPTQDRRIAGVSSFGFSGTNAHLVLEAAPPQAKSGGAETERPLHLLTLSARTAPALKELAKRYRQHIERHLALESGRDSEVRADLEPDQQFANLCFTANVGRAHFSHRLALTAPDARQANELLEAFRSGETKPGLASAAVTSQKPRIAFLFTGQGSQYLGMGRELYETQPAFRATLDRCDALLRADLELPLLSVLFPAPGQEAVLDKTAYTQPALFALEYALAQLWRSWSIEPAAVMGHSVGEYVAACLAGVFSLEDGLKLIAQRARLMQALPAGGAMCAVFADVSTVRAACSGFEAQVSIAAVNGPDEVVISGEAGAVRAVATGLEALGIRGRPLTVSHAFHSPLLEPMLDSLEQSAAQIRFGSPKLPLVSNLTGELVRADEIDAGYWRRHARQTVAFQAGMETLFRQGIDAFLEIGPGATLLAMGRKCVPESTDGAGARSGIAVGGDPRSMTGSGAAPGISPDIPSSVLWLPSLRKGRNDWAQLLESLAALYTAGAKVDWGAFDRPYARRKLSLPTYPFLRRRFWIADEAEESVRSSAPPEGHERWADLCYERQWVQANRDVWADIPPISTSTWLIFLDAGGVGQALIRQLELGGARCIRVEAGEQLEAPGDAHFRVNPSSPDDFITLLQRAVASEDSLRVVFLWALDTPGAEELELSSLEAAQTRCCGAVLHLVQAMARNTSEHRAIQDRAGQDRAGQDRAGQDRAGQDRAAGDGPAQDRAAGDGPAQDRADVGRSSLWLVTRLANRIGAGRPAGIASAPLWGLGRAIALEHPELWGGLLDLDEVDLEQSALCIAEEIAEGPAGKDWNDTQVAWRRGTRYLARLERCWWSVTEPLSISSNGTYLITGGLGALGMEIAAWLVERGARHLVLAGRSGASPQVQARLEALKAAGARVRVEAVDVARPEQVSALLEHIHHDMPPLRGLLHAAGVVADSLLERLDWARFQQVLAPKVSGAWNLHTQTLELPLDFFILFSSAATLLGAPGQANYVAANSFLEALAAYRRECGLPGVSIAWGPWQGLGMAGAVAGTQEARWREQGITPIPVRRGLEVLEATLRGGPAEVAVLDVDWDTFQHYRAQRVTGEDGKALEQLRSARREERAELLAAFLRRRVARAVRADEESIPGDQNLIELGMDSLMVMEVLGAVKQSLRLMVYPREFYEHPTLDRLSRYLAGQLDRSGQARACEETTRAVDAPGAPDSGRSMLTSLAGSLAKAGASHPAVVTRRNPPMIFLLSTPRSGSTLLRVMLAGHPALFSPPELHLLPFQSMLERQERLGQSYLGEGLHRALMELLSLDASASRPLLEGLLARDASIQEVYALLQSLAGPRLLVDKSPSYVASLEVLRRAEALFENARYIHLVRHPYAVLESYVRMRMDRILGAGETDPYALAEALWATGNRNVMELFQQVDPTRRHLVRFEELVENPAHAMANLCEFLHIPFKEAILRPYEGQRMTDGLHAQSASLNDPNFLERDHIDASLGEVWSTIRLPAPLGAAAQEVARALRYELPVEGVGETPEPVVHLEARAAVSPLPPPVPGSEPAVMHERVVEVRGLPLTVCTWGPEPASSVLCVHGLLEHGGAWIEVAEPLAQRGFRVLAPDHRGHGRSGHAGPGGSYHFTDLVADLDAVDHALIGEPAVLVGHSMGAVVAAAFAAARPGRVRALILVEGMIPPETRDGDSAQDLSTLLDYLASPPPHPVFPDLETVAARLRAGTPSMTEKLARAMAERLTEPCEGGVRWRWDPLLRTRAGLNGPAGRSHFLALLRRAQAPITLVFGDRSDFTRLEQRDPELAALPGVRRVMLSGGHNLHFDAPGELARVIAEAAKAS